MDYRDWLIRQQQQERIQQGFEALFTKDEERARSGIQGTFYRAYRDGWTMACLPGG
jgi:hypothetical protein